MHLGVYAEPGNSCFGNERFYSKFIRVETNLVEREKDKLVPEELINLFITLATVGCPTFALKQLYVHLPRIDRVIVTVDVEFGWVQAQQFFLINVYKWSACFVQGQEKWILATVQA